MKAEFERDFSFGRECIKYLDHYYYVDGDQAVWHWHSTDRGAVGWEAIGEAENEAHQTFLICKHAERTPVDRKANQWVPLPPIK